jgi:hypothetical protein
MWAVIVAGHLYTDLTGRVYWDHATCVNLAAAVGGRCVQAAPPPPEPPSDGGWGLYQQCVQTGACKPF